MDAAVQELAKLLKKLHEVIEAQSKQIAALAAQQQVHKAAIIDMTDAMGAMLWVTTIYLPDGTGPLIEARLEALAIAAEAGGRPVLAERMRVLGAQAARPRDQGPAG